MSADRPDTAHGLDVAICLDENVLPPAVVLLRSIEEHAQPSCPIRVHALTTFEAERLRSLAGADTAAYQLVVRQVDDRFSTLPRNDYISQATYLRFLLPDLLPDIETLVYLDIDMVVHRDLSPLRDIALGDLAIGATSDTAMRLGSTRWERFDLAHDGRSWSFEGYCRDVVGLPDSIADAYFNAGLLIMNLPAWRRENLSRRAIEFIGSRAALKFLDQDALNNVVQGRYARLDSRWNSMANCLDKPDRRLTTILSSTGRAWERARDLWHRDPWVIHFAGPHKPWNTRRPIVLGDIWWDYARRSGAWPMLASAYDRFTEVTRAAREAQKPLLHKVFGGGSR